MMGVYLDEPDAALRYHLGLKEGQATMIVAVHAGLPADEAGIEPYDIIVAIDGAEGASPQALQESLSQMDAGDEIALTVIQEGQTREVTVALKAYDAEAMRTAKVIGEAPAQIEVTTSGEFPMPQQFMKHLEGLELKRAFDDNVFFDQDARMYERFFDADAMREEIMKQFTVEAQEQAHRLAEQAREIERGVREQERGLREKMERLADDRSKQIDRLEDRMRELERMLERLIDRLDRQERRESRS
jgi:membrane-associated protease RseP (regulator of RpoE activity)